jgi:predicted permease
MRRADGVDPHGAIMADHLHEFHSASGWRVIGTAVLRIAVLPLLFLLLAKCLPASLGETRIVLAAAMPAAVCFPS